MSLNADDAQQEPIKGRLNLNSLVRLEALLGTGRVRLRLISGEAGSSYRPFHKREKHFPFEKKPISTRKKPRIIDNPEGELKKLQSRINKVLLKPIVFPAYLCGGIPGKTVLDNVLMHLGAPVLVVVDIKNFFRRITNQQVYYVWREVLGCSPKIAGILTRLTTFERHLPQGAPTSSLLANLVLFSIDRSIRNACAERGVTYSTWVDDIAFSGKNARDLVPTVVAILHAAGFSISHKKLKVMGPGTRKVLNGVLMNRFPNILPERISRLRSGIHKLRSGEVCPSEVEQYVRQLQGGIAYVASISAAKSAKLHRDLDTALIIGSQGRRLLDRSS
jgi:retron-type reverse transcriptase